MNNTDTNSNLLKIIIISIFAIAVVYFLYISIARLDKVAVHLETFPADTKVVIDDKNFKRGTIYLEPGVHTINASHSEFKSYSETIEINSETTSFAIMLDPSTDKGREMLNTTHRRDYDRARELSYKIKGEEGARFSEENPITKVLPDKSFIYSIGYIGDQSDPSGNSIIVTIDANEGYRQAALNRIHQLGYDPTDLNILFRDYENPFPL